MFAGYNAAGTAGALVALVAIFLPSAVLTSLLVARWDRLTHSPWLAAAQRGLAAVAFGLGAAGAYSIVRVAVVDRVTILVALAAFVLLWRWRLPPALVILLGGAAALAIGLALG